MAILTTLTDLARRIFDGTNFADEHGKLVMDRLDALNLRSLGMLREATVVITTAQMLALNSAPKTLVAAPGAGKTIEFVSMTITKSAGTAYVIDAGDDFSVKYTDGSGAKCAPDIETTGFLDQTTVQTRMVNGSIAAYVPVANAPIVLHMLGSEVTTGVGIVYCRVRYRIVDHPAAA